MRNLFPKTLDEIYFKIFGFGRVKVRVRDTETLKDYLVTPHKTEGMYPGFNLDRYMNCVLPSGLAQFWLLSTPDEIEYFVHMSRDEMIACLMPNYTVTTTK